MKKYATSNFYLAAFLIAKGLHLIEIDAADPRRASFIFEDTPECRQLAQVFSFGMDDQERIKVNVRQFIMAIKGLKDALHR